MPQFQVKTITQTGKIIESVVSADTSMKVYDKISGKNESVLSVKKYKEPFSLSKFQNAFYRIKPQELENFTSQLVVMLRAGVPLVDSLETIGQQLKDEGKKGKAKETAKELIKRGVDMDIIEAATGLSSQEIKNITSIAQ